MHIRNKAPLFVPVHCQVEIEKLSKAALMDMVWDYATQQALSALPDKVSGEEIDNATMEEFRKRREVIVAHRKRALK